MRWNENPSRVGHSQKPWDGAGTQLSFICAQIVCSTTIPFFSFLLRQSILVVLSKWKLVSSSVAAESIGIRIHEENEMECEMGSGRGTESARTMSIALLLLAFVWNVQHFLIYCMASASRIMTYCYSRPTEKTKIHRHSTHTHTPTDKRIKFQRAWNRNFVINDRIRLYGESESHYLRVRALSAFTFNSNFLFLVVHSFIHTFVSHPANGFPFETERCHTF